MAARPLDRDRRVRSRLRRAFRAPAPRLQHRPLRPWQHGAGRVVDGARRRARGDGAPGAAVLAARRALRPDPGRLRTALVAVARPDDARRRPGDRDRPRRAARLSARPQAPRLGPRGRRLRDRVSALSADAVARSERVPPGRARDAASPRRLLVPRRGPTRALRRRRRRRLPDEGAHRPRRRRPRALVRVRARPPPRRPRHRSRRHRGLRRGDRARRAALRAGRLVAVRRSLPGGRRRPARDRRDARHRSAARARRDVRRPRPPVPARAPAAARGAAAPGAARRRDRAAGAPRQSALDDAHAAVDPLPLHGCGDPRARRGGRLRRRPAADEARPRHRARPRRARVELRARSRATVGARSPAARISARGSTSSASTTGSPRGRCA